MEGSELKGPERTGAFDQQKFPEREMDAEAKDIMARGLGKKSSENEIFRKND